MRKTWQLFFRSLEFAIDQKVAAKTFMSDDASQFYKAWSSVMGVPQQKLLCAWHVDRNWQKKIHECVEKQLRPDVYHNVRLLLEFLDQQEFQKYLQSFLNTDEEKLRDFLKYFKDNYAVRPQEWAYCFRTRAGINTNMHLESMHKTLKHSMLEGRKNKRVDKLISALMDLTYHFLMKRAIQMIKGAKGKKLSAIERYHRSGTEMAGCAKLNEDGTWTVPSQSTKGQSYTVTKVRDDACCPLRCKECAVCVHTYMCTCYAHLIHFTVCKHIHCVVIANTSSSSDNNDYESPPEMATETSQALHIVQSIVKMEAAATVSSSALFKAKMESVKQAIVDGEVSEEVAEKANKLFEPVFLLVEGDRKRSMPDQSNEPANKKVERQVRFHSTKKPRLSQPSSSLSRPTEAQKEVLKEQLMDRSVESAQIITSAGHDYS
uniref:Tick transposon n=1 Tax=Rhipicephalus zambeziensis TaxID=60191 RepID=A0A224Z2Y4_9ACAR